MNSITTSNNFLRYTTTTTMKLVIILAVCVAGALSAATYYEAPKNKVTSNDPAPVFSTTEAPQLVRTATYGYAVPEVKQSAYYSAPLEARKFVPQIVRFNYNDDNMGNSDFDFLSEDKTHVQQSGSLKDLGDEEGLVSVMKGFYSFVGDDGNTYAVNWVADENGFQPTGDHLPTSPPPQIPEENQNKFNPSRNEENPNKFNPSRNEEKQKSFSVSPAVAPVFQRFEDRPHHQQNHQRNFVAPVSRDNQVFDGKNIHVVSHYPKSSY